MSAAALSTDELRARDLAVVAVGGSAGGIDALRVILSALKPTFPLPIVVVLHVGPDAKTAWPHVFAQSPLRVCDAEDKSIAAPGSVHFAPPDYHLLVDGSGELSLSLDAPVRMSRPSIDVMLESVAYSYGERALGIVLSGANSDGALGLAAIGRAGGVTWVQTPESSSSQAMPRAALSAVPEARALTPRQMAEVLNAHAS